jgi:hypothetical protein
MFEDLNEPFEESPAPSARTTSAVIFDVEPDEFVAMMRADKPQAVAKLKQFRGQKGLCSLLHTDKKRGKQQTNVIL